MTSGIRAPSYSFHKKHEKREVSQEAWSLLKQPNEISSKIRLGNVFLEICILCYAAEFSHCSITLNYIPL